MNKPTSRWIGSLIVWFAFISASGSTGKGDWTYVADLPGIDRQLVVWNMPGSQEYGSEVITGTRIPLYSPEQAARIALEYVLALGPKDAAAYVVEAITGMRESDGPLQSGGTDYDLCLLVPTLDMPTHIKIPGGERYVLGEDGGRRLLFTTAQAKLILESMTAQGFGLPEIAAALAGFRASRAPEAEKQGVRLAPSCGFCQQGAVCDSVEDREGRQRVTCCQGTGTCQACTVCPLTIGVYLPFDP